MIQSSKTRSESSIFSSADKEIRPPVGIELRVSWQVECHGKGFTLVELLVVMAVLAILSAMTLSALATARGTAETARCNSNARQLGLAARMYWDDFNNESFPYRSDSNAEGIRYWFGRLGSGSEGQRILHREFGPLYSYLRNSAVWNCPSLGTVSPEFKLKANERICSYGYNRYLSSVNPMGSFVGSCRISDLISPSSTVVFADSAQVNAFQPPASPDHPLLEEFYYLSTTEATVHFRHRQLAVAAFADGHVDPLSAEPGSLDLRLPGHFIGRLPTLRLMDGTLPSLELR